MFRPSRKKQTDIGGVESSSCTDEENKNGPKEEEKEEPLTVDDKSKMNKRKRRKQTSIMKTSSYITPQTVTTPTMMLVPYFVCVIFLDVLLLSSFGWKSIVFSIPVMLAGGVVVTSHHDSQQPKQVPVVQLHTRIIALAFVSAIFCAQFPAYISKALGSMAVTLFGLVTIHDRQLSSSGSGRITSSSAVIKVEQRELQKNHHEKSNTNSKNNNNNDDDKNHHHYQYSTLQYQQPKPKWSGPMKTFMAAISVTCSLLIENFFIWVVSATFYPSHSVQTTPPPLQDNGRIILAWIYQTLFSFSIRHVKQLRQFLNVQWGLVSAFGATLVCCEIGLLSNQDTKATTRGRSKLTRQQQHRNVLQKRTLWSVALRALLTLATARAIRTISFLLTVLPSQVANCYTQHFPNPPPSTWYEWLMVGILPNSHGGCNDLIISGHATVTSTLACASTSVASNTKFSIALWTLVAIDYSIEIYEGFHYSVDMWMGALLTSLLWRIYVTLEQDDNDDDNDGIEDEDVDDDDSNNKEETFEDNINNDSSPAVQFRSLSEVTTQQLIWYGLPGLGAFVVVAMMPEAIANYWIVFYIFCAATNTVKNGLTHYTQHLLICTLFIALAIYL